MQTQIRRWLPIWTLFSTNCKVTVWKMKRVKTLPATELDHFLSTEIFFMNKRRKHGQEHKPATIFNAELSRMKRSVELLSRETRIDFQTASSCVYVWMIFTATNFLHPCFAMLKLKYFMQGRQKPFSEFQQTAAVETFDKFRYKSSLKPCLYSTWFMFFEFVFKLVVPCEQL